MYEILDGLGPHAWRGESGFADLSFAKIQDRWSHMFEEWISRQRDEDWDRRAGQTLSPYSLGEGGVGFA